MELRMKYNYSYFIYPYVIKNYNKYVQRLLNSERYTAKYFEREKDISIYNYFLPTIRDFMFKSFGIPRNDAEKRQSVDEKIIQNMFKDGNCAIFTYNIGDEAQAKTADGDGIFFKIEKIEVICFKSGICFITMKTNIEDTNRFSDLLNFNVKFRDINSEASKQDAFGNIKIQTNTFSDIRKLSDIIREIAGSPDRSQRVDIDINRFMVYSYVCIDQEFWNETREFSEIEKEFFKFANVLNSESNPDCIGSKFKSIDIGKYTKIGISKAGVNLLTSSVNTGNYTTLPFEFENEYFYTYIFALYEKFYMAKLISEFSSIKSQMRAAKEFVRFTNDTWVHDITNNEIGSVLFDKVKGSLSLGKIYERTKEQYDVAYKAFKMKNSDWLNKIILVLLAASIITNIVNFVKLLQK